MPLYDYYDGFFAKNRIDIVSEDHLVVALADRLEFYDFASNTHSTLLDGEDYQCDPSWNKRVYAMPTGHFMYVKDPRYGDNTEFESWMIFDSEGNFLFTKLMTESWFDVSVIGSSFNAYPGLINDRFYIPTWGIIFNSALLECHFPCPDSLHVFIVGPPVTADEGLLRAVRFGDDRILRLYIDYGTYDGDYFLYMNYSPLEDNPVYTHWAEFGPIEPHIDSINDKIVSISARYENYIFISVLCTLDFPTSHTFTFPAPTTNIYLPALTFSHEDQLFMISDGTLYAFEVEFSVSNADETAVPPVYTFSAYPNPVNANNMITFKASLKQATELDIYNIRGQKVDTISLDSEGTAEWNLRNYKGETVARECILRNRVVINRSKQ